MNLQLIITLIIVSGAAYHLGKVVWGMLHPPEGGGCGSGCGKCSSLKNLNP